MRLIALLLVSVLALGGCDRQNPQTPQGEVAPPTAAAEPVETGTLDRSKAGTAAPDATFENGSGEPTSLADFRGKPLLVNLWATWCAPCVAEMPTLDRLAASGGDLQVIAVSQDLDGREKVETFFTEQKLANLEAYLDPDMALMTGLAVGTLPTTILFDPEGRELWRMTGQEEWDGPKAAALIKEAK